ncbi:MAG: hypothetical protein PHF56_12745 [Desulfuromonadaceae bacterium]|nr:hypothetical protein [Desulfuromonadaceae bacterium]
MDKWKGYNVQLAARPDRPERLGGLVSLMALRKPGKPIDNIKAEDRGVTEDSWAKLRQKKK